MSERACGHTDPWSCDLVCRVAELERAIHPEGRCWCGAGKPYWKHIDPTADGWHPFVNPTYTVVEKLSRPGNRANLDEGKR